MPARVALREQTVLAQRTQRLGPDHPDTVAARREHRLARAKAIITRIVDDAPELTDADRETLAALLRPTTPQSGGQVA